MASTSPLSNCLEAVENVSRTFRGQPIEIKTRNWDIVNQMAQQILSLKEIERISLLKTISRDESGLLFGIARSAAEDSVIENNPSKLRLGLLALIFENLTEDYRESLMRLCLLDHSAKKLGILLEDLFDDVRASASEKVITLFDTYFREGERNIEAMGFVEDVDRNGDFTYTKTW